MIETDICIIGAGPVGLFAVFEAGLLRLRCHVVDVMPQIGGQLTEIYPKKPIYDIPGYPMVMAGELIENLEKQIEPFHPTYTLGERVEELKKLDDGSFELLTSDKNIIKAKVVVIAAGLGCFEPRKPAVDDLEMYEGKGVHYMVRNPDDFIGKNVVIAGGGDSALDWAIHLCGMGANITLVHRGNTFRGAADSAEKVVKLDVEGKLKLLLNSHVSALSGNGKLENLTVVSTNGEKQDLEVDNFIPLFGLSPKLGPIEHWNLNLDNNAISVNVHDYSTDTPGIFAIGDINTYPGKLKLILSGFHEAALMAHGAYKYMYPDKRVNLKYTTVNGIEAF